jgi:ABC-type phosphate transport system substrate-binding protein
MIALSTAAILGSSAAKAASISDGVYMGGSTLASEVFRQVLDCYMKNTVGGDTFIFSTGFDPTLPTPGWLPTTCTTVSVQGMYAGVGSGNGFRGYISNKPAQWYGGTLTPTSANATIATPFPAGQPPFVDSSNSTNFGTYPYPRVDIGLSDSPLAFVGTSTTLTTIALSFSPATNWATGGVTTSTTQITLNSTTNVSTYSAGSWGNPIQIPAFEVNVAIPVNVNSTSFIINSQIKSGGTIVQGGAIQLTEAQMCAIFSGLVTDWHDSTTVIPYRDNTLRATTVTSPQTTIFSYANVGNGHTAQAYANVSLPITVVYRSDGSGTSFILTNYLHHLCPLLDPPTSGHTSGNYGYTSIFGGSNLPSTSFSNLITNIVSFRGNGVWNATTGTRWLGESGSGGVAATISDASTQAGYIGYVSADFTNPYASKVSGAGLTNVDAPLAASLQNEALRIAGTNIPPTASTTLTFIAPTPIGADDAWSDSALLPPATNSTWSAWNVYGQNYGATVTHGNLPVGGHSVLALTNHAGAYPLAGTTYMALYSCYGNTTNGQHVINLLKWLYGTDQDVTDILNNNGFSPLLATWQSRVNTVYLNAASSFNISLISGGNTNGCSGVTGGANP